MKLIRFELKSSPGEIRSGMVRSGRIYETNGLEAVAVHEAADVRPLPPIAHPPSLRVFRTDFQGDLLEESDFDDLAFFYTNPRSFGAASHALPYPEWCSELAVLPCVAATIVSDVANIDVEYADDTILGFTLLIALVARDAERRERRIGLIGRSHDLGGVFGPVITTPEELDEAVDDEDRGRHYDLAANVLINGVEKARGGTDFPFTFAQAISVASRSTPLRVGDLVAIGPVANVEGGLIVEPGDQIQLAVTHLGALALHIATS